MKPKVLNRTLLIEFTLSLSAALKTGSSKSLLDERTDVEIREIIAKYPVVIELILSLSFMLKRT
ncbi:MAG: hypothetical protein WBB27_18260 [Maribacter sp.]